jgi:hypothetical protein
MQKAVEERNDVCSHKGVTQRKGIRQQGHCTAIMIASAEEDEKKHTCLKDGKRNVMTKRRIEVPLGRELTRGYCGCEYYAFFQCRIAIHRSK